MKPAVQEQTQAATNRATFGALDVEYDEAGEGGRADHRHEAAFGPQGDITTPYRTLACGSFWHME